MVYEQIAKHHRHFLLWRQYLFAGYFFIVSTLIFGSLKLKDSSLSPWIFVMLVVLSCIFIGLEKRNTDLYTICQKFGATFEEVNLVTGVFTCFEEQKKNVKFYSHTDIIMATYFCCLFLSILAAVYLFIGFNNSCPFYFIGIIIILVVFAWFLNKNRSIDSGLIPKLKAKLQEQIKNRSTTT